MTDKKPKIDQLWIVEGTSGRYVKVVKQGRKWLHLESKYGWDDPRVSYDEVLKSDSSVAIAQDWNVRVYLSEDHWKRSIRRSALIHALRDAFERWTRHDRFTSEGLEVAAKALGIEVKDG